MCKTVDESKARPDVGCTELLGCPHCGADAELVKCLTGYRVTGTCQCWVFSATIEAAIKKWNHRQPNAWLRVR